MKDITTYSARRSNLFVWLAVLLMLASAVTRCIWLSGPSGSGPVFIVIGAILPLAANLFIAVRLPLRGEKYFYVTVKPFICLALYFIYRVICVTVNITESRIGPLIIAGCILLCLAQTVVYYLTFSGRIKTSLWALLLYLLPSAAVCFDPAFRRTVGVSLQHGQLVVLSDIAAVLGIICTILSARRLPPPKEGDPYRFRYGDRMDGRLIRGGIPLDKVAPYIMVNRNGANNLMSDSIDVSAMEKYVHKKRREGLKHFGITHVLVASYMRMCAEYPGAMRFISGQKVYQRMFIRLKMVVKKDLKLNSPETIISVDLLPSDTADDIYRKFDEQVQLANATSDLDSAFDKLAGVLNFIPGVFLKFAIWFLKLLDYFGLIPVELTDLSPFHGSVFITSMGSLGIPPIYHHLYDFGNIPVFVAFGAKRTEYAANAEGQIEKKRYLDYKATTDERIVDGQYYAACFKKIRSVMLHPDQLDLPPETVKEDIY